MAQAWDEELRARGYRVTPQRQLVLEAVTALEHATPEEICTRVQQTARGVNISTVYRTLELLEQLGLVTHSHLTHGAPRYHLAAEAEHVHLVCRECGRIDEVGPAAVAPLVTSLENEQDFETDVRHLTVFGRCGACRKAPASEAPASEAPVSGAPVSGAPVSGAPVSGAPESGTAAAEAASA
jgi:Fur family transcriptional regulator, ferric uptake regulator